MLRRQLLFTGLPALLLVSRVVGAEKEEASWESLAKVPTGAELRIYRKGTKKPVQATMDRVVEDRLVVGLKNEQVSYTRDEIERVDARDKRSSVTRKSSSSTDTGPVPGSEVPYPAQPRRGGPSGSTESSVSFSKANFQTVYRAPKAP